MGAAPQIPYLTIPDAWAPNVAKLNDVLLAAAREGRGLDDFGCVPLGQQPLSVKVVLAFLDWFEDSNDALRCMNLIVEDLEQLPNRTIDPDHGWLRFGLLARSFYGECYRLKELPFAMLHTMERLGCVSKGSALKMRGDIGKKFKDTFDLRNKLVHSSVSWRRSPDLAVTVLAYRAGWQLLKIDTFRPPDLRAMLERFLAPHLELMRAQGTSLSEFIQELVNGTNPLSMMQGGAQRG